MHRSGLAWGRWFEVAVENIQREKSKCIVEELGSIDTCRSRLIRAIQPVVVTVHILNIPAVVLIQIIFSSPMTEPAFHYSCPVLQQPPIPQTLANSSVPPIKPIV